ncbi:MAG: C40 family peptidase [Acidimicrobiia bacterium]|nr:C40 family peptidase [Acidimicrobiia bacterium]
MKRTTDLRVMRRLGIATCCATTLFSSLATIAPAGAAPSIAGKQAEAAALRAQIERESMRVGVLAEQYNGARVALEDAQAQVATAQAAVDATVAKRKELKATLARRAASLYRGSGSRTPFSQVDPGNMAKTARIAQYGDVTAARDNRLIEEVKRAEARLAAQRVTADTARANAARQADSAGAAYREASAADRSLRSRLSQIDAETKKLIEQQRAEAARVEAARVAASQRQAAAQRAATEAARRNGTPPPTAPRSTGTSGSGGQTTPTTVSPALTGNPYGPPPAVSSRVAEVIAYAQAQIGKPYSFATSGPSTFDCSGLTKSAWGSVGVRMPHYSGAQAVLFPKISFSNLQPGDLVLFYDDLHHVGLYIGGGMMINAPQTGDFVKVSSVWRSTFQWGVRPS